MERRELLAAGAGAGLAVLSGNVAQAQQKSTQEKSGADQAPGGKSAPARLSVSDPKPDILPLSIAFGALEIAVERVIQINFSGAVLFRCETLDHRRCSCGPGPQRRVEDDRALAPGRDTRGR